MREKEMQHLSRSAVTTNRLDAIRERDPREAHRRLSRSPSAGQLQSKQSTNELRGSRSNEMAAPEQSRTSSSSSRNDKSQSTIDRPGQNHERQASHDYLRRLARAISTTPKSSPPASIKVEQQSDDQAGQPKNDNTEDSIASSANAPGLSEQKQSD